MDTWKPINSVLIAVFCDSETHLMCNAVGTSFETPGQKNFLPIAYQSSNGGSTWSIVPLTPPVNSTPPTKQEFQIGLYGVQ